MLLLITPLFSLISIILTGCHSQSSVEVVLKPQKTPPNILWLVVEDMSPYLSMYGDSTVSTPAIHSLAKEGITFTQVFSPSGVCAPSRAAIATGLYPSSFGANHMRTTSNTKETGLPKYEAVPPENARMLSQYMRKKGYYTTNNYKTDYQFKAPASAWHDSSTTAHWRNRPKDMPFFSVINFTTTHESGLFEPYGIRHIEARHGLAYDKASVAALPSGKTSHEKTPVHISQQTRFTPPPYLPDTPEVQRDLWKMYNNIIETDKQIASVLKQLQQDNIMDNTIIIFYADHGGPLPRQKRLIYDSGLRVPFIIRYPDGRLAGTQDDRLISFIDFLPTTLGLVGGSIPKHLHGKNIFDTKSQRQYIHAAADRFDGFTDTIRAVRDKRFKYIRNYRPQQGYYLPVVYREKIPTMRALLRLKKEGGLTPEQAQWFRSSKPEEELFDTLNDPHELVNLANTPAYQADLKRFRHEMDRWLQEIDDNPLLPERKLIDRLWAGSQVQPVTLSPIVSIKNDVITLQNQTQGAVLEYRNVKARDKGQKKWLPWPGSFRHTASEKLEVRAHRIGYIPSSITPIHSH